MPSKRLPMPDLLREASRAHKQGHLDHASALYQVILASNPRQVEALHLLSLIEIQNNEYNKALQRIDTLLAIDPKNASALLTSGIARHRLGQLHEALECYDRALAIKPGFASALNNRGNVLRDLNRPRDALGNYDRALALKPVFPEAFNNRGIVLRDLKRLGEALQNFDRAIALKPDYADALNNRGNVLADLKRPLDALKSYETALAHNPFLTGALNNRGSILRGLKRYGEALASFDRAIALNPGDAQFHNNRGNVLANLGRSQEALESYDKALALNPGYAEAYNNKGLLWTELGRPKEAEAALETAVALAPGTVRFYYNLSEYKKLERGDHHIAAMEALAASMHKLGPDEQIDLHFALGKAYADIGEQSRSFQHLLEGNAQKFRQMAYDEAAQLAIMDRMRTAFTAGVIEAYGEAGDPSAVPVFIIGMPRSGSTLVEQILACHPGVHAAGEIDDFDRTIQELAPGTRGPAPETLAALPAAAWRAAGARYFERIRPAAPGAVRITNKKLNNFRIAALIHLALPNARIIHTLRDPLDTCVSCFSKQFADELPYTYSLGELGRYYRAYTHLMAHWRAVLPAPVMLDVRYEDVIGGLEEQARRIVSHCGLDWDPRCLDFHKADRPVRTASKTQVRQPLFQSSVGRWRVHEAYLGPLLAELPTGDITANAV